jgi:hypothetical protein
MKLEVNINKKVGVINITSKSFILEDLKAHICKKMKLDESDFKMKISFGDVPKVEMIEVINNKQFNSKESYISLKLKDSVKVLLAKGTATVGIKYKSFLFYQERRNNKTIIIEPKNETIQIQDDRKGYDPFVYFLYKDKPKLIHSFDGLLSPKEVIMFLEELD